MTEKKPRKPRKQPRTASFPAPLLSQLDAWATEDGRPFANLVCKILTDAVEHRAEAKRLAAAPKRPSPAKPKPQVQPAPAA